MAKVHRFRRLRHGEPRKLSTPDFLREERTRERGRHRFVIVLIVVAIAAAVALFGFPR